MTARQLRNRRREAERKARKLEYQQNRRAAAAAPAASPAPAPKPNFGPTGPRTPEGKAISSANSLKHGLASGRLIIPGEDREDFEALLNDLIAEHAPATPTEEMLVQQMAQSWWLMHRAIRVQNQAFLETWCDMKKLALFLRYQTTYERAFYRAFNSLKKVQKERLAAAPEFVSQNPTAACCTHSLVGSGPCPAAASHAASPGSLEPHAARDFVSQKPVGAMHASPFQPATTSLDPASGQNGLDGSSREASTYNS